MKGTLSLDLICKCECSIFEIPDSEFGDVHCTKCGESVGPLGMLKEFLWDSATSFPVGAMKIINLRPVD